MFEDRPRLLLTAVAALAAAPWFACAPHPAPLHAPIQAAYVQTEGGAAARSATEGRLRYDIAWLCSTELAGRRAGSPEADAAAAWLSFQLRTAGLDPAGSPREGFLQEFALPAARQFDARSPGTNLLTLEDGAADSNGHAPWTLRPGSVFPTLAAAPGVATGVLADLDADGGPWDSQAPKIAVAPLVKSTLDPGQAPSNPHALPASLRSFAFRARQRGAVGLLVSVENQEAIEAASGEDRDVGLPALYVLADALPPKDAWGRLWKLDAGVVKVSRRTRNVLGRLPAAAPGAPILVVGAHYDHLGLGGTDSLAPGANAIHHGADDNASGTALVLELARRFAPRRGTLRKELVFAFWGGEELGLLGSKHWVRNPTVPFERVVANVNFDMVGRSRGRKLDVGGVASSAGWKELLESLNRELPRPLELRTSARLGGIGGSDHMSFQEEKRPALFFFTGLHDDYHKPTDVPEKIEYGTLIEIVDLAERTILALDSLDSIAWVEPPAESGPASRGAEAGLSAWLGTIPDYGADDGGVVLAGTSAGSPAAHAGLRAKDVVKRVGVVKIDGIYDLTEALRRHAPGDEVEVEYVRDGELQKVQLRLGARRR